MSKLTNPTSDRPAQQRTVASASPAAADPAVVNLDAPSASDLLSLQRTIGNRAVNRLVQSKLTVGAANDPLEAEADAMADQVMHGGQPAVQRAAAEEELLQGKPDLQRKGENATGLPDALKSGIESLSGLDMSDVKVHYNSDLPAQMNALAYTQGTDIHVAPGQEKHLEHEAWHVVQQKQGRVKPTMQL